MSYDLKLTPEQVQALGSWVEVGSPLADVELVINADGELEATQGDDYARWSRRGALLSGADDQIGTQQQDDDD